MSHFVQIVAEIRKVGIKLPYNETYIFLKQHSFTLKKKKTSLNILT